MNKRGFILAEALVSLLILTIAIEFCFSFIVIGKKMEMRIIKQIELKYKTKAKMEEMLHEDYELVNGGDGVEILEINPGLKLIRVCFVPNFKLVSLKNED